MNRFLIKVCVSIIALVLGVVAVKYISPKSTQTVVQSNSSSVSTASFSEQREESDVLFPDNGQAIIISNINGSVELEYADVAEAEVKIIRSANKQEDFDYRRFEVNESRRKINVRMRTTSGLWRLFGAFPEERQRLIIKAPRGTIVKTKCINGYVEERKNENGELEVKRTDSQCSL